MAVLRLIPTTVVNSAGSQYLTIADEANMKTNCDSTTYGTITNIYASTSSRYVYLRGFNFGLLPANAEVSSFTISVKASETGASTSTNYRPRICNGSTTLTGSSSTIGTSVATITFTSVSDSFATIKGYGDNFGIRINARRAQSGTQAVVNVYGAEIIINYTVPVEREITSTLTGNGTISPSGTNTYNDGDLYSLTITPTNTSDAVSATYNGTPVTLTPHYTTTPADPVNTVLGTYRLISGGFSSSGATYFQGIVGHGHTATKTTSNYYSSGSSVQAVFRYAVPFTLPSGSEVTRLYMIANGHPESTSNASEYMCVQLVTGNKALSPKYNFKDSGSTSNSDQTVTATIMPSVAEIAELEVECTLGYYGGAINGVTVYCEYGTPTGEIAYYTYSFLVSEDATIAVTISGGGATDTLYLKVNGSWVAVSEVYLKVSGSWVKQTNLRNTFSTSTIYEKGN